MQLGTNRIVVVDRWRSVERLFVTDGSRLANPNLKTAAGAQHASLSFRRPRTKKEPRCEAGLERFNAGHFR
jgi:hypothetical protein